MVFLNTDHESSTSFGGCRRVVAISHTPHPSPQVPSGYLPSCILVEPLNHEEKVSNTITLIKATKAPAKKITAIVTIKHLDFTKVMANAAVKNKLIEDVGVF